MGALGISLLTYGEILFASGESNQGPRLYSDERTFLSYSKISVVYRYIRENINI